MRGDEIFSCSVVRTYKLNVESVCNVTERISVSLCIIGKKNAGDASDSNLSQQPIRFISSFLEMFLEIFRGILNCIDGSISLFFFQITTILPNIPFSRTSLISLR